MNTAETNAAFLQIALDYRQIAEVRAWMAERYPDWKNPVAYWNAE